MSGKVGDWMVIIHAPDDSRGDGVQVNGVTRDEAAAKALEWNAANNTADDAAEWYVKEVQPADPLDPTIVIES